MRLRPACLTALAVAAIAGCSSGASSQGRPSSAATDLTIYAAASLDEILEELRTAYESAFPGTSLTISTDSSAALESQIEQGAPADVFLSADMTNPQKLVDAGLAAGPPVTFGGNRLAVIVPVDNPAGIRSPADLARSGVKVIAAGTEVPITRYASQLVDNLAHEAGYAAGFAAAYAANVASREDNVKAVVAKIELGEGDAAIVYATDADASAKVMAIEVPEAANVPARYDGVVVKSAEDPSAATAFLDWLAGPDGQAILTRAGFLAAS